MRAAGAYRRLGGALAAAVLAAALAPGPAQAYMCDSARASCDLAVAAPAPAQEEPYKGALKAAVPAAGAPIPASAALSSDHPAAGDGIVSLSGGAAPRGPGTIAGGAAGAAASALAKEAAAQLPGR